MIDKQKIQFFQFYDIPGEPLEIKGILSLSTSVVVDPSELYHSKQSAQAAIEHAKDIIWHKIQDMAYAELRNDLIQVHCDLFHAPVDATVLSNLNRMINQLS